MSLQRIDALLHPVPGSRAFWGELLSLFADKPQPWDFDTWAAVLELARIRGLAVVDGAGRFAECAYFGPAWLRRWRWMQESVALGLSHEDAARDFDRMVERERERQRERQIEGDRARVRAIEDNARAAASARRAVRRRATGTDL